MNDSLTGDFQTQIVQQIAAHQPRLRAFVRCLMVPSCDVDDLVQEINAVLWEKADRYDPNSDFWAWASQIARFKTLNHVRKRKREPIVFDDQVLSRLADVAEQRLHDLDDRRDALLGCLETLPPAQRQLIDLRYTSGLAIDAISQATGRPGASISQTLYRLRNALLNCINRRLNAEGSET